MFFDGFQFDDFSDEMKPPLGVGRFLNQQTNLSKRRHFFYTFSDGPLLT